MDYNRGGKRGRSPNRRFAARGYRRRNVRGNYYQWRPNWNYYNSHYSYPYPEKPPSPLPGTEEYRQRNIQQTSELIKKQLNIDSDTCNTTNLSIRSESSNAAELEMENKEKVLQPSTTPEQKKTKSKKNQVEKEEIDVQEIYDKIIKHISNLSYSKKLNLINQSNSGYDIAIQQIQKQKQLELSKALRDMSQRPTKDTDEEVIQSIIPDIGIKLEDLPNNVIEKLSKTLQVKFENDDTKLEISEPQVVDMNISPINEIKRDGIGRANEEILDNIFDFEYLNKTDGYEDTLNMSDDKPIHEEEEYEFSMANIDVTKSYLGLIELPKISESNVVQEKKLDCESPRRSDCGIIRVKTDIFETPKQDNPSSKSRNTKCPSNLNTVATSPKSYDSNSKEDDNLRTPGSVKVCAESLQNTLIGSSTPFKEDGNVSMFDDKNETLSKPISFQHNPLSSPFPNTHMLSEKSMLAFTGSNENLNSATSSQQSSNTLPAVSETSTLQINTINDNINSTISCQNSQHLPSPIPSTSQQSQDDSLFLREPNPPNIPISNENLSRNTSLSINQHVFPFEQQIVYSHISPLLRGLQTPPHQVTTDIGTRKRWKSPGEKKMIPSETEYRSEPPAYVLGQANTVNKNVSPKLVGDQDVVQVAKPEETAANLPEIPPNAETEFNLNKQSETQAVRSESPVITNKSSKNKSRPLKRKKQKKVDTPEQITSDVSVVKTETPETETSKLDSQTTKTYKDVGVMTNIESKHKRAKKMDIEVQTENIIEFKAEKKEYRDSTTMTDERKLITVSAQTPIKFFKKNLQVKAVQTTSTNYKSVEIQATERMKNVSIQTTNASEDPEEKCTTLLSHLKLLQEIDEQMKELLAKRSSLYENIGFLNQETDNKNNSNKKKKSKKNKNLKDTKSKISDVINQDQTDLKLESNVTNPIEVKNVDAIKTNEQAVSEEKYISNAGLEIKTEPTDNSKTSEPMEIDQRVEKNKSSKNQTKEVKDKKSHQPDKPSKHLAKQKESNTKVENTQKVALTKAVKENKETENKPLKISLKVEKDVNNIKKYSLKRNRSRSSSKDSEPKPKRPALQSPVQKDEETTSNEHAEKCFKVSKEIETLVYSDNKFMKKCCVKIKPLKNIEDTKEIGENDDDKASEYTEENSGSPKDQIDKELNLSSIGTENIEKSPHSCCSPSSTSSGRQKSKVIDKLEFKGLTGSVYSLKAVDDQLLAAGDDGILYFFNVTTQDLANSTKLSTQALTCLHVLKTDNECLIYVTCLDGNLRIVDYKTKEMEKAVDVGHGIQCMDVSWGYVFLGSITGNLDIYSIKAGKLEDSIHIFDNRIYAIKAMQEGARRVLLMGAKDTELSVRDAMTGLLMRTVQTKYSPTIYSILSDQNLVYCGTNQHDVLVYSFQDGGLVKKYEGIASRRVICMQIVDNLLFVGCFNGSVCVFQKSTHQYLGHMIRPGESLLSMLIVNNKVIVGLKNNKLVSWDVPVVYLEKNR